LSASAELDPDPSAAGVVDAFTSIAENAGGPHLTSPLQGTRLQQDSRIRQDIRKLAEWYG